MAEYTRRRFLSHVGAAAALPSITFAAPPVTRRADLPAMAAKLIACSEAAALPTGIEMINSGATWAPVGGGLPELDCFALLISTGDPDIMHATIGSGFTSFSAAGLYRSTDAGTSWSRVPSFPSGTDTPGLFQRHTMGKQPLFDPCHEYQRKLQSLGGMQRHQLHR